MCVVYIRLPINFFSNKPSKHSSIDVELFYFSERVEASQVWGLIVVTAG